MTGLLLKRLPMLWTKILPPFPKKFVHTLYFGKSVVCTFITILVLCVSPAPRVISALPVMPLVITNFADDATCAILSARIFKRKSVQNFWSLLMSAMVAATVTPAVLRSASSMLPMHKQNINLFYQNPAQAFHFPRQKFNTLMRLFPRSSVRNSHHTTFA